MRRTCPTYWQKFAGSESLLLALVFHMCKGFRFIKVLKDDDLTKAQQAKELEHLVKAVLEENFVSTRIQITVSLIVL